MIAKTMSGEISAGRYGDSHPIPSEPALARRFGVARGTVRLALDELRRQGVLESRRGSGTFVKVRKGSGRLGLLIPDGGAAEIFHVFIRQFSALGNENGYVFLYGDGGEGRRSQRMKVVAKVVRDFIDQRCEGVIFRPFVDDRMALANREIVRRFSDEGIPVVLIDSDIVKAPARSACDLVGIDNVSAGRTIGEHLVSLGRRRIAFLMGGRFTDVSENWHNRLFGLRGAVTGAGLPWSRENVVEAAPDDAKKLGDVFRRGLRPDAIACGNDREAAVLVSTLRSLGLRIPKDVAVAGFDDSVSAQVSSPTLTTVHQPVEQIAEVAFGFLMDRIRGKVQTARSLALTAPLIRRGSTMGDDFRTNPINQGKGATR